MSFTSDVRDELSHVEPECSHCEKATLAALVRIEGTLFLSGPGKYRVEIATDSASVGRLIIRLLHSIYDLKTQLTARRSILHKTPNYLIEIPAQKGLAPALRDMGIITADGGLRMGVDPSIVSKGCCSAAYLRGAFLGSGFISNPKSDFHFEMIVETAELAEDIVRLMSEKGINAKINAELANQQKATKAAVEQLFMIREVLEEHDIETLPPALQEFIRLRVAYPDASLKELGNKASPPLSKSAMNHRVRRLEAMMNKPD